MPSQLKVLGYLFHLFPRATLASLCSCSQRISQLHSDFHNPKEASLASGNLALQFPMPTRTHPSTSSQVSFSLHPGWRPSWVGRWASHIGWDSESYLAVEQVTCPLLVGKILRGPGWNIRGIPTHGLDTEWGSVERYWVIPTQSKDAGWGGWPKDPRRIAHPVERYWVEGLNWEKVEEYLGLSWKMLRSLCFRGLEWSWLSG